MVSKKIGLGILLFGLVFGTAFAQKYNVEIKNSSQFDVQHIYGLDKLGRGFKITDFDENKIMIKKGATCKFSFSPELGKDSDGKTVIIESFLVIIVNGGKHQQVTFPVDFSGYKADSTVKFTLLKGASDEHIRLVADNPPKAAPAPSSPPDNREGWVQNADGTWTYNPGKGRAIPK